MVKTKEWYTDRNKKIYNDYMTLGTTYKQVAEKWNLSVDMIVKIVKKYKEDNLNKQKESVKETIEINENNQVKDQISNSVKKNKDDNPNVHVIIPPNIKQIDKSNDKI